MADRRENRTDDYSFRFFSPEQVDQILRGGFRHGREGSHAAIERILKHEPELERAFLWQRIRRLKCPPQPRKGRCSVWSPEDEKVLREGYGNGWRAKREAVQELLRRHPDWRPHLIWRKAAKLGLIHDEKKRGRERSGLAWSEEDDRTLLDLAGYRSARVISKLLHRSEAAVRARLTLLGKSSRVHFEGFSRFALSRELHLSANTIQRLIVEGLLEVRDPRITRESLDRLRRSGCLEAMQQNGARGMQRDTETLASEATVPPPTFSSATNSTASSISKGKTSRAKRAWAEVTKSLNVNQEVVEKLIARGALKLYDPRITEKSLLRFCRRNGSLINSDFLSRETRDWLQSTMDFIPHAGEAIAICLTPLRKHARVVHQCRKCGRSIRGNVFFRHTKRCKAGNLEARERHNSGTTKPNPPKGAFSCSKSANNLLSS
ncbi:MAG: hypothetical protein ACYDD2_09995 [Candidatus Acidiferrales bacterium]